MKKTGRRSVVPARRISKTILDSRMERNSSLSAIKTFRVSTTNPTLQSRKESLTMQDRLNKERLQEIRFKNFSRSLSVIFFGLLLLLQNAGVFFIVFWALETNKLESLQPILAGLVAATLTETYLIAKKIIDFVFSNTDYVEKNPSKSKAVKKNK